MTDLSNWRPIAFSSCLYKFYTAVLADRLSTWAFRTLSSIQKGFVPAEGCLEHNFLLQQCLDYARESGSELCVSWLHLKNAFGSVPHSAILALLRQHGVHQDFVDIVEKHTPIAQPPSSHLRARQEQSPWLRVSNKVILRSVLAIAPLYGFQLHDKTLSCLAFADDIVLLGKNRQAIQCMLDVVGGVATWVGLHFNAKKCATLCICKKRANMVNTTVQVQSIPSLNQEEAYQHLGVPTGLYVDQTTEATIEQMLKDLSHVENSLLTDWQKLDAVRTFILPQATFVLQTSRIKKTCFTQLDQEIKRFVKKALHLPARASNEIIYLPTQKGGANIMPLSELADVGAVAKAFKVLTSPDPLVRGIAEASLMRSASRVVNNPSRVFECVARDPSSSHFIYSGNRTRFCDWRFIFRARLGVLPLNAALRIPDRNRSCRRRDHGLETTLHVLNNCLGSSNMHHPKTWKNRHSSVIKNLVEAMDDSTKQQLRIEKAVPGSATRLLPDLVLLDEQKKQATIIDIACPFENRSLALNKKREKKCLKYEPICEELRASGYIATCDAVVVGSLGSWDPKNERAVNLLGICPSKRRRLKQ
ncbi:hypothetical protein FOCC_FOCC013713 [Frankliniella occidentalis]|nr:hypothetical protein FOCC_FOCC013713 [Frankliniella occidentalis]